MKKITLIFFVFSFYCNPLLPMQEENDRKKNFVRSESLIQHVCNGDLGKVKQKLSEGANINHKSFVGTFSCFRNGNPALIILINLWNRFFNQCSNGLIENWEEIFLYLLQQEEIEIDCIGIKEISPLYLALRIYLNLIKRNNTYKANRLKEKIIIPLIKKGADPNFAYQCCGPYTVHGMAVSAGLIREDQTLESII